MNLQIGTPVSAAGFSLQQASQCPSRHVPPLHSLLIPPWLQNLCSNGRLKPPQRGNRTGQTPPLLLLGTTSDVRQQHFNAQFHLFLSFNVALGEATGGKDTYKVATSETVSIYAFVALSA